MDLKLELPIVGKTRRDANEAWMPSIRPDVQAQWKQNHAGATTRCPVHGNYLKLCFVVVVVVVVVCLFVVVVFIQTLHFLLLLLTEVRFKKVPIQRNIEFKY